MMLTNMQKKFWEGWPPSVLHILTFQPLSSVQVGKFPPPPHPNSKSIMKPCTVLRKLVGSLLSPVAKMMIANEKIKE